MYGCYILERIESLNNHSGVGLKIRNQIDTLNNAGLNCSEIVLQVKENQLFPVLYRLPFSNVNPVWHYDKRFDEADYIYMRRPFFMNGAMRKILSKIKKNNPTCKIIVEIPTYPYDDEYKSFKLYKSILWKDKYNRNRMKGLIDRFAILTEDKEVFGIPTIKIKNGINIDLIHKRVPNHDGTGIIHICAVAVFCEWHGYERFIEGVKNYYAQGGDRNIICHFVGEGSELPLYKKLVKKYSLDDHFVFHGYQEQERLDNIYDLCSIALGSFGMYKIGLDLSCNLKSREAVARGIPMVTGCKTDIFEPSKYIYFFEYPNDASILDINKMIEFHDRIYQDGEESVIKTIRQYAYDNISMDKAMQYVIEYIRGRTEKS